MDLAEEIAKSFHDAYELFGPKYVNARRVAGAYVAWGDLHETSRRIMVQIVRHLLDRKIIAVGSGLVPKRAA